MEYGGSSCPVEMQSREMLPLPKQRADYVGGIYFNRSLVSMRKVRTRLIMLRIWEILCPS